MSAPFDLERLHGTTESWKVYLAGLPAAELYRVQDELEALKRHPAGASFKVVIACRLTQVQNEVGQRWSGVWHSADNRKLSNEMHRLYATG